MNGIIFDIKEFAVFDGPGIRTTVFMKGCPLRCRWCHNPEGLCKSPQLMVSRASCIHCGACEKVCPSPGHCTACGKCVPVCRGGFRRIVGENWTPEELTDRLKKDWDIFRFSGGGVTFSGGEPLLQWEFISEVTERLGKVPVALETSGFVTDQVFQEAMRQVALVMMDWKVSDPQMHRKYTGVSQEPIRRHLEMLLEGDTPFILRMPLIPGVNDNREHFQTVASMAARGKNLIRVEVLPYQRAAGAKYEMVGMRYQVDFEEDRPPEMFPEEFEKQGIPFRIF